MSECELKAGFEVRAPRSMRFVPLLELEKGRGLESRNLVWSMRRVCVRCLRTLCTVVDVISMYIGAKSRIHAEVTTLPSEQPSLTTA